MKSKLTIFTFHIQVAILIVSDVSGKSIRIFQTIIRLYFLTDVTKHLLYKNAFFSQITEENPVANIFMLALISEHVKQTSEGL